MNKTVIVKVLLLLTVVILLLWFNQTYLQWTPSDIRLWILSFGWLAPALYLILYTFRPFILFPASILSLAGGLAFGPWWGTLLTVAGATSGAMLSFLAARYLGKNLVKKEWKGGLKKVQTQLETRGLLYIVLLRLIPLFPFDLISYVSGVSKVRFRAFFFGTLFGIVPGTFAYNLLGSSFSEGSITHVLMAAAVFIAALVIPLLFKRRLEGEIQ